jgi:hypothetical protein
MSEQILSTKPSLYEAKFKPNAGVELHRDLPKAAIHSGLLNPDAVKTASAFFETVQSQVPNLKNNNNNENVESQETSSSSSSSPAATTTTTAPKITKEFINFTKYGHRAIVLHNVLTPQECVELSSISDQIEMSDANPDHRYRNNMRCEVASTALAHVLFQRVFPFVEHEKVCTDKDIDCYTQRELMIGTWKLCGINDHFRLCYYLGENKGHFGAHYDGEHHPEEGLCSIKTFMLYLNDDYSGGETNFVSEHNLFFDEAKNIFCSPPEHVVAGLKAKQGDCLIFDHKILHEGATVTQGKKFICRTELMYRRVEDGSLSENQKKGREFLTQARYFEDQRDFDTAVKFYQKAFKICPELEKVV